MRHSRRRWSSRSKPSFARSYTRAGRGCPPGELMAVVFGRSAGAGAATPTVPPPAGARRARRRFGDRGFREITRAAGLAPLVLVAGMAAVMAHAAWPSLRRFGWAFITTSNWDPVAEQFGALPFIFGTLVSSLLALLLAVPLGLGAAIYLAELAPRAVRPPVTFLVEMLAAIPRSEEHTSELQSQSNLVCR